MELNQSLKDIILKNQDKINNNEFLDIYKNSFNFTHSYDCNLAGKFTYILYDAGIDPLKYMNDVIPECFLFEVPELPKLFINNDGCIPKTCISIQEQSFFNIFTDDSVTIIIPENCLEVREYAFGCSRIHNMKIECINKCNIWMLAFYDSVIHNLYLNDLPNNWSFLLTVDKINNLYLPISDNVKAYEWIESIPSPNKTKILKKIENIILSNGELLDI